MSESMKTTLNELCQKDIATASDAELYTALLKLVQEPESETDKTSNWQKTVLYFCRIPNWKITFQQPDQPWSV